MTSIYNQTIKLFGSQPEPGFESQQQQTAVWGRQWGCDNDVGQIRLCLMHRPGDEMNIIDPAMRIDEIGSFGDREKGWYFQSDVIPDWDEFRAQHDALVQLLRDEGVEVVFLDDVEEDGIKSVYTRDSSIAIKGGALVTRLARSIRRGEEAHVSKTLAGLGMPILRTLHGTALMEGGSFAWLNSKTAVIARSICVNDEGCDQVEQVLNAQGAELLRIDMAGYDIHIDGALTMIDVDLAIVDPDLLPYGFLRKLDELGVRTIEIDEHDDPWIVNCLAVSPGRIIMPPGISSKTEAALQRLNQEVIEIDYDKIQLNGGGIHCSTCPLIRDSVD
jgi:N-dimethylarginine dimethylaminohydrolase